MHRALCERLEQRLLLAGDLVHAVAHLPTARQDILAVTVGNEAIFAGGTRNTRRGYQTSEVDVYDAHNRRWYRTDLSVVPQTADVVNGQVVFSTSPPGVDGGPTEYIVFNPATAQTTLVPPPSGAPGAAGDRVTVAAGSKLVTAGGFVHDTFLSPSSQTEVFDATTHAIATDHQLSDPGIPYAATVGHKAVFVDRTLFAYEQSGFFGSATAEVYDADTDQWTTATLPAAHTELAVASVDGVALFAGGRADTIYAPGAGATLGGPSAAVDIYHAGTNTFTTATLSQARTSIAAASVGHYAVFAGGTYFRYLSPQALSARAYPESTVDLYDTRTGQWSTASLSAPNGAPEVATAGDVALFYGNGATVDVFDAGSNTWSVTTLPPRFHGSSTVTVGGDVIFYGQGRSLMAIYDTATRSWTTARLSAARSDMAVTAIGNTAVFAGGTTGTGLSDAVDLFSPADALNKGAQRLRRGATHELSSLK
jgi:hypothetical protein